MDETNFSLDGSDGGRGGRPASSITISGAIRPGTSANKSNVASTLMCGSNAAAPMFRSVSEYNKERVRRGLTLRTTYVRHKKNSSPDSSYRKMTELTASLRENFLFNTSSKSSLVWHNLCM